MDVTTALLLVIILLLLVNLAVSLWHRRTGSGDSVSAEVTRVYQEVTRVGQSVREESSTNRHELEKSVRGSREELNNSLRLNRTELSGSFESIRQVVDQRLQLIQTDNAKKLEEMRLTVDEKLQATVERRFNESFTLISTRLDAVHKGLGEMQTLAVGVGDLKRVLSNVKTRGILGEIQLGAILEQILAPEQFQRNVAVRPGSQERVEFCVLMPGQGNNGDGLMLPIDSKFPNEDYQRLLDCADRPAEEAEFELAARQFELSIRKNAKTIADKYINPPHTTEFAIMFVPTEGLYAEIVRRTALFGALQRDLKVLVVGPTNLAALLHCLQMGFRTLAIEKRSSEVWDLLGAVKTEFGKFGELLDKTKKKLVEATNTIDSASQKSRTIERKLRKVQESPTLEEDPAEELLPLLGEPAESELES
jgi:DNA recombination protein RmuC